MKTPSSPGRAAFAGAAFAFASLLPLLACSDHDSPCERGVQRVESCQRMYKSDVCADPLARCQVACLTHVSCEELDRWDSEGPSPQLSRCFTKCKAPFRCDDGAEIDASWKCDGAQDCTDGSDERACHYFECASGQPVRNDARCDGYAECADGSDEEGCP